MAVRDIITIGLGFSVNQMPTLGYLADNSVAGPFYEDAMQFYYPHDFSRQLFTAGDSTKQVFCPTDVSVQVEC